jgi:hypothetical protein
MATAFDKMRKVFVGPTSRCFLLKRAGQTSSFAKVGEVASGWFYKFDEYRGQVKLAIATTSDDFSDLMAQTSYVAMGVPAGDGSFDVYSIDPSRRDIVPPDGTSPFWKVFITKEPIERYAQ